MINEDGGKDINSMHEKWIFIKEKEKKRKSKIQLSNRIPKEQTSTPSQNEA
jgi:hypothetical protein